MSGLTHVAANGRATMVDISDKPVTLRTARAEGVLICQRDTLDRVRAGASPKGAVIHTAELAGTMAVKRTADLIPLCHPLPLTKASVAVEIDEALPGFRVFAETRVSGPTGVEMEALTAVSVACLTLYDMLKAIDRMMTIGPIEVIEKRGGQSGDWAGRSR